MAEIFSSLLMYIMFRLIHKKTRYQRKRTTRWTCGLNHCCLSLISEIVDKRYAPSNCIGKMHNDLKIICLAYCLVIT